MQAEKSAFFIYQTSVMPLLGGKGTGLPRIRVKAALRAGRLKENHPRCAPVFSFAKPCTIPGKQAGKTSRNKNAYPCRQMSH